MHISLTFFRYPSGGMFTPASPWMGSNKKAATFSGPVSKMTFSNSSASPYGIIIKPGV